MNESGNQSSSGGGQRWSRPQYAVAYKEARSVLKAQQTQKTNLDSKAFRSARLTTVIAGAVISAVRAFDLTIAEPIGYLGGLLFVVAFGAGIFVYNFSAPIYGPGEADLEQLVDVGDEDWEQEYIAQMGEWISTNKKRLDRNLSLLLVSDVALFAGVVATFSAIVT